MYQYQIVGFFHHLIWHKIWSWSFIIKSLFFFLMKKKTCGLSKHAPLSFVPCTWNTAAVFTTRFWSFTWTTWVSKAWLMNLLFIGLEHQFTFAENEPVSHGSSLKIWKQKRSLSLTLQQIPTMDDGPWSIKARTIGVTLFRFKSIQICAYSCLKLTSCFNVNS